MARFPSTMVKFVVVVAAFYIYPAFAALSPIHGNARRDTHAHLALARNADVTSGNYTQPLDSLEKRSSNAKFTNFPPGENACGGTSTANDFIVALNAAEYGNGENCFKTITISYGGKSTQAKIVDECPGCPFNGLDLSPALFAFFADLGLGVIYGDWEFADAAPSPSPKPTTPKPTPTPSPKPTSTSQKPTLTSTSTSASLSTSSPTSSTETTTSASSPLFPPETNNIEGLNLLIVQLGGFVAAGAGVVGQDAYSSAT